MPNSIEGERRMRYGSPDKTATSRRTGVTPTCGGCLVRRAFSAALVTPAACQGSPQASWVILVTTSRWRWRACVRCPGLSATFNLPIVQDGETWLDPGTHVSGHACSAHGGGTTLLTVSGYKFSGGGDAGSCLGRGSTEDKTAGGGKIHGHATMSDRDGISRGWDIKALFRLGRHTV